MLEPLRRNRSDVALARGYHACHGGDLFLDSAREAIVDYHRFVGTRPDGGTCNLVATRPAREKATRGPLPPDERTWTVTLEDGTPLVHVGKGVYRLDDMTIRSSDPQAP